MRKYTINLEQVSIKDIDIVGGKNASLGEMINNLSDLGIKVPDGFALKTNAYINFLEFNQLTSVITKAVSDLDTSNLQQLRKVGKLIRSRIMLGTIPTDIEKEIRWAYQQMCEENDDKKLSVAVRSSATAEDLPTASFAGQQETFLNVTSEDDLLQKVKSCFSSLFTDRAISYREEMKFDQSSVYLSICVQKMVRSDVGTSGVAFSIDTESGFKDVVLINASYGLGELLVQGSICPDEYLVFKKTKSIIEQKLGSKEEKMVFNDSLHSDLVTAKQVSILEKETFCLSPKDVLKIADWVMKIEKHYSEIHNKWCPVDVEWAIDGISGELYIVQARPETNHSNKVNNLIIQSTIENTSDLELILEGTAVGDGIGQGKVCKLKNISEFKSFSKGDVLVTNMTDPNWEPIMKLASAIVTNKGGRTCHAAIVSRELGIPAIVGTINGVDLLEERSEITVSCAEGERGNVYLGYCDYTQKELEISELPKVSTPLMLNVASPDAAFKFSFLPNSGVGLAREEFIINNYIKVHPLALLKHKELNDAKLSASIKEITKGYPSEKSFFINKLAQGIAKIGAAFYDKPVIVRFSDFKSNEYRNLLGGKYFEPNEENPMIGWRGAVRYYSDNFKAAFGMECEAIKKVRDEMGLTNIIVMIPFCRTLDDCKAVLETMKSFGLERGENGLKIYLMAEIPSNFILADQFAEFIDGFSIGSNDLTQLTLGLDRDSELVSHLYDERNP
ncbi:MAG: phosphoenolpyruvate synthase, partial [Crocinitomicaceae bacterium]|nr:phosphoenolpyruvate synthase [Crocinitomicaceae bacterium]